jgi:hypothetical protein
VDEHAEKLGLSPLCYDFVMGEEAEGVSLRGFFEKNPRSFCSVFALRRFVWVTHS